MAVKKYKKVKENILIKPKGKKDRAWFTRDSATGELVKTRPFVRQAEKIDLELFPNKEIEKLRHSNRKNHNQYFTPEFAVEKAISLISETKIENIIDPAVGNGIFLKVAYKKWKNSKLFGIDIDKEIVSILNKSNLPSSFICSADSLLHQAWQIPEIKKILLNGGFDLVVGNPPFSSWFNRIGSQEILSNYELAKNNGNLKRSQAIEILFLEIFIKIAKEGGFIAIVLPDGILSNPQYRYVREFILRKTKVLQIINLPRNIFEDTSAKTSILILQRMNMYNLKYYVGIYDLNKKGELNNKIKAKGEKLLNRMDYNFYYNFKKCSLRKLGNNGLVVRPLDNFIIYCKTGKTLYGKDRVFSGKGLHFLHTTNIADIGINYEKDKKFIQPNSKMDFKNAHTRIGDILIARVGNGCVGKCGIISSKKDMGIVSDCIFTLRINKLSPYFVSIFLKTKFGKEWFNAIKHGSAATSIAKNEILSIPIPLLPKNTQGAIEKQYKKIITNYHRNGNDKDLKIYQCFKKLIKNVEEKITNGKNIQ